MKQYNHHPWSTTPFLSNSENLNLQIGDRLWISDSSICNDILSINNFTYLTKAGNSHSFQPYTVFTKLFNFLPWLDKVIEESNPTFLTIGSKKWIEIFGKWYGYYLDLLKELDILVRVPYQDGSWFIIGEKSCQYRITNNYKNAKDLLLVQSNQPSTLKLKVGNNLNIHKKFKQAIKNSEIDFDSYLKEELLRLRRGGITSSQLKIRVNRILATYGNRKINKGENVDRIYHSFSNISKTARNHLVSPKSERYLEIDVSNCHPILLIILLNSQNLEIDKSYIDDVQSNNFYDQFIGVKGSYPKWLKSIKVYKKVYINLRNREEVKPEVFNAVLFDFKPNHPLAEKFKELYPITHESLCELDKRKEFTIAGRLQNIEASIFNKIVPKHSKHFFTLHDAIYYTDDRDSGTLRKRIGREFEKHGVKVKVKKGK